MDTKGRLFENYRPRSIHPDGRPGTEMYLKLQDAFNFAGNCVDKGLAVGRIEGFGYENEGIHQRLDLIWEFEPAVSSWAEYRRSCNESAFEVLSSLAGKGEPLVITFVIESEDDWLKAQARMDDH